ncbi:MAG TPA: 50S ribosomal protein L23 [Thermoplasmata archaeon]|uniref:Large ribosomal subunit protein uL23 n=1 Tax=uncultured euryarchaeote Rifle_16ft_4_minimus_39 TaxID=1665197 RepID=A0A0H4TAU8_9EURY|nr:50S ribosomal protein L23P [uncultured euryarchaeote Rifle_16ft_4_minimus_39]
MDPYKILLHPYVTEKTMNFLEGTPVQGQKDGNRLEFIVRREATKPQIKEAFEVLFEVKVEKVNTYIHGDGKHAIIKLRKDFRAEDVALRIGVY